ncbi:tubulin-tyrosine ligase [Rhynchospora pubera]|uniref:Tubulin-tyrosine ligase n=1 Tax=Rhynchospora pubera TaxID=906938 RepID=A0AAV8CXF2_9POAL|nr:tubulin-tyrosine ligase [Rhynchospora pubera]
MAKKPPTSTQDPKFSWEEVAKKLSLWHTATFRPIQTHDDLEPILASAGFSPVRGGPPPTKGSGGASGVVTWREYEYCNGAGAGKGKGKTTKGWKPRPRLPLGRLDGLHLFTYEAFLISLEFYLGPHLVPNLFHVRAMPVTRKHDMALEKTYRPMRDCGIDEEGIFVYREGTLDQITKAASGFSSAFSLISNSTYSMSTSTNCTESEGGLKKKNQNETSNGSYPDSFSLVPLKDLFPSTVSFS